jgi:transcriptional regulator with XRE-family HTH domain
MTNERLRNALAAKHVSIEALARKTEVDPKTVQRWIGGRTPHQRHRWKIAEILGEKEEYLWPEEADQATGTAPATAEILAAYAQRTDVPASLWWELITKAEKQIDFLGFAMLFLPEQHPDLMPVLKEKSQKGCRIRIAVADPHTEYVQQRDDEEELEGTLPARIQSTIRHFKPLRQTPNIEVGLHRMPLYNSIFRFDEEMFVTPHLYKVHGSKAPLLHLRQLGQRGLFRDFASHFENVWVTTIPVETTLKQQSEGK